MRSPGLAILLAVSLSAAGGCTKQVTAGAGEAREAPPVEAVSEALSAARGAQAVRAAFRLEVKTTERREGRSNERKNKVTGELVARAPDALWMALTSILGPPVGYAAIRAGQAGVYLPYADNTFLSTAGPGPLLERISGGALTLPDVVGLFLGKPPPCRPVGGVTHRREDDRFIVRCEAGAGGQAYQLALEPGTLRVAAVEGRTGEAGESFSARFGDYRDVGGVPMPYALELEAPSAGFRATVRYDEIELNPAIEDEIFTLTAPSDARQAPLELLFHPRMEETQPGG